MRFYVPKRVSVGPQPQGILQAQQVGLSQAPFKSLLLPCVPVHVRLCIVLQEWSLCFSQSHKTLVIKTWCSSNVLGAPHPDARPRQDREPGGLSNFTPVGEFLWCNYSSDCGLPTWGSRGRYTIYFIAMCPSFHLLVISFVSLGE